MGVREECIEASLTEERCPQVGTLRQRLSLMPQLLKEVFAHPREDSILVKQGDEVLVARRGADLHDKKLDGVAFRGADLREANLQGASLSDADLQGADLSGVILADADLHGADLTGVTVTDSTDFSGADLTGVRADSSVLRQAKSDGALLDDNIAPEGPRFG